MAKKNFLVIILILSIPLLLIILSILDNSFFKPDDFLANKEIPSKLFSIDHYELILVEQIENNKSKDIFEYPLDDYNIFPYTILWKDTLSKIAYKFNLSKDEIAILIYLNKIKNKDLIIAGNVLLIAKRKTKDSK
ncbi:MAG: LysM peptidoglycan-binding domain-containing protein [Exilispira sp.]